MKDTGRKYCYIILTANDKLIVISGAIQIFWQKSICQREAEKYHGKCVTINWKKVEDAFSFKILNKAFVSRSKPAIKKAKTKYEFPRPTEVIDKW